MTIFDDLRASFGDDYNRPSERSRTHWCEVCVCGHLDRYHGPSVGGTYVLPAPVHDKPARDGTVWSAKTVLDGCRGALSHRGFEDETETVDHEAHTMVTTINPSCPCDEFRPIAKVDRPNRYFNQRLPLNRADPIRHPFTTGVRAFTTHLSRRRAALTDPAWPAAEFDRRFLWLDGKRRCGLSKCTETDGVWPVYIDGERSELRCPKHR